MTNDERMVWIFQDDIARRRELIRISSVAIGLHEERIAGHRETIATESEHIARLEREIARNMGRREATSRRRRHLLQAAE